MPTESVPIRTGLYPRLLGDRWLGLDEAVRRMHDAGQTRRARGLFRVAHGEGTLANLLLRLSHLPATHEAVETQLKVTCDGVAEKWTRDFGGESLVSEQREAEGRLLAEKFGAVEFRFHLEIAGGGLTYHQKMASLRAGSFSLRLPHWAAPRVTAREERAGGTNRIRVSVAIRSQVC